MSKHQTFQESATKAHDLEVTIASCRDSSLSFVEPKRDRPEVKKNVKFSENSTKEMTTVTKAEPVHIIGKPNSEEKRGMPFKDTMRRRPTLKELQEKKYSFPDSDSPECWVIFLKRGSFNF